MNNSPYADYAQRGRESYSPKMRVESQFVPRDNAIPTLSNLNKSFRAYKGQDESRYINTT